MKLYSIFLSLIFLLLTGCAQHLIPETTLSNFKPEPPREKKDFYLSVIDSDASTGTLKLIDDNMLPADTLAVHAKDRIHWLILDANVSEITGIRGKSDRDQEKFKEKPQTASGRKPGMQK